MPRGPRESLKHGANVYSVCIKDYMCMCVLMGRKIINFIKFQMDLGYKNIKGHSSKDEDMIPFH